MMIKGEGDIPPVVFPMPRQARDRLGQLMSPDAYIGIPFPTFEWSKRNMEKLRSCGSNLLSYCDDMINNAFSWKSPIARVYRTGSHKTSRITFVILLNSYHNNKNSPYSLKGDISQVSMCSFRVRKKNSDVMLPQLSENSMGVRIIPNM